MIDAFIVGAGPSGLFMAAELIRQGLTCRLIDKSPTPSFHSKAIAIQARTLEILMCLGLADTCLAQGLKIEKFAPYSQQKALANITLDLIASPFKFVLSLEQNKFEKILIKHLEERSCLVERQIELLACTQDEQKITVTTRNNVTGEIDYSQARWLIGCDGAHSIVRKQTNQTFEGLSFPQIFSLADIELEWKYARNSVFAFLNRSGLLAAIPLPENKRVRLIFQTQEVLDLLKENKQNLPHGEISANLLAAPTLEKVAQIIHQYADSQAVVKKAIWMTNFNINSRMVSHYQQKRFFLVGDAAHIHSPVGGQGMNTGLQDAFNLGWKLALVSKGQAKDYLLESYHEERHWVGKNLLHGTEKATNFALTRSPFLFYLRNGLIAFFGAFTVFKKIIVNTLSQINIAYPQSRWIKQKKSRALKLKAGMRAPNAYLCYKGDKTSIFNIWKESICFILLVVKNALKISEREIAEFLNFKNKYDGIVNLFIMRPQEFQKINLPAETFFDDTQNQIKEFYGNGTVYLIRPDGYIGYCGPYDTIADLEPIKDYFNTLNT